MATIQPIIKEITLNRTVNEDKSLGSFGFSIMGGAHSKLPAAVCSVESDGPAAISGKVSNREEPVYNGSGHIDWRILLIAIAAPYVPFD